MRQQATDRELQSLRMRLRCHVRHRIRGRAGAATTSSGIPVSRCACSFVGRCGGAAVRIRTVHARL